MNNILGLYLNNFSLFSELSFNFNYSKRGLILVDKNGSGKTSILKSAYLILCGKSVENEKLKHYVKTNNVYFKLSLNQDESSLLYAVNSRSGHFEKKYKRNRRLINPKVFVYLSRHNNWFSLERAKKLCLFDYFISQIDDGDESYNTNLKTLSRLQKNKQILVNKYKKIFKDCQKNKVFFDGPSLEDEIILSNLNTQIFDISIKIWEARDLFFAFLINNLKTYQSLIETKIENIKLRWYKTDFNGVRSPFFDYQKDIDLSKLKSLFMKEVVSGRCLFGAGRDDFNIEINDKNITNLLSTGEMRLFVLFFQQQFIKLYKLNNKDRLIWWFLDDVFNELDEIRENRIYRKLLNITDFWFATSTRVPGFYKKNKDNISISKIKK